MKNFLAINLLTFLFSLSLLAQDSVDVTFRYYPENSVTRVMLPGDFNNFGPNSNGVISPTAVSLMQYNGGEKYWFKTLRLEIGGGPSTFGSNNEEGYRYKFHEHYNASGSSNNWIADPLNNKVANEGFGDSWVKITHPMIFQLQPKNNSVFQLQSPEFTATVAAKDDDPISPSESKIFLNGQEIDTFEGFYNQDLQILTIPDVSSLGATFTDGTNSLKLVAVTEQGATSSDSTQFTFIGVQDNDSPRPVGLQDGITYTENGTSATFSLFAPYKENVFLIGDFNDWSVDLEYQMKRDSISTDSMYFWYELTGLTPGQEYGFQYLVDGEIRVADPYSELVLDEGNDQYISESVFPNLKEYPKGKTSDLVGVLFPGKQDYQWEVTDFEKPANDELIIYELLVRDFLEDHSYTSLIDTLDYLANLGINAIEFMPINEFDGNESWGYNPSLHGALDKYYGSPNEFKRFVDEAHKRGIAVILDVVLNHSFGQNPIVRLWNEGDYGNPTAQNPYFNTSARHPFNVGYDFNHESPSTRYYSKRMMEYWLTEYNVDGFRFDLSKGFTQTFNTDVGAWGNYDQSRVNIWKDYSSHIWSIDPNAYVILEHFASGSEETALSNEGMMLWGNMNHEYNEATMGYGSNLSGVLSQNRGFSDRHLVGYMESHDEQWLMFKNISFGNSSGDYNVRNLSTALDRMELAGAFFYTLPGPKMIWQFSELGYGYGNSGKECLRPSDNEGDLGDCPTGTAGRTGKKPIRWDYNTDPDRKDVYNAWSDIINLRRNSPAFTQPESSFYALSGSIKYIRYTHTDTDVVIIGNFGVTSTNQNVDFTKDGTWYDFFGATSIDVSGKVYNLDLAPGEFKIYTTKQFNMSTPTEEIAGSDTPSSFRLYQNYPNPFNPTTNLTFDIAQTGAVSLEVYDVLGRKVADLVNGVKTAGTYTISFDASSLSSGLYLVKLQAGQTVQVQKMTLLK